MAYEAQTPDQKNPELAMDDSELLRIIDHEEQQALGQYSGDLSNQRAKALDYYLGAKYGDEIEGRSQVVTSDVFDAVEGALPAILDVFASSEKAVEFTPHGMEDVEESKQATDLCNYIFYKQNNGFLILYNWFKDAFINKNGIVKIYYDTRDERKRETYKGLTDEQLQKLVADKNVELVGINSYPDPDVPPQAQMMMQVAQAMGQPPPPPPQLHDVEIIVRTSNQKVCVDNVPPEEFLISNMHRSVSLQDCEFCAHRRRVTLTELRQMGHDVDKSDLGEDEDYQHESPEVIARNQFVSEQNFRTSDSSDESMSAGWVTECYIKVDYDQDGIAELRRVLRVGRKVLENEEISYVPFAALTPNILPHQFYGLSFYDVIGDIQYTKSAILRQMLDSLYLANMPRLGVLSTPSGAPKANLDDLLTARPGGIIRMYEPGAVVPIEQRFVGQQAFPMLEYQDSMKENRSGITRYNQGVDADSLNKTATGVSQIMGASQQKLRLMARIFAETGVKELFRCILKCASKYSSKPMLIRLRNEFVPMDPRQWKTQWDMTVNVGLGTGDKREQLQQLAAILEVQKLFLAGGKANLVDDKKLYNTASQMVENSGLKHTEAYFNDPDKSGPPPPAPPPPELLKAQMDAKVEGAKLQQKQQAEQLDARLNVAIEQMKAQTQKEIEAMKLQAQKEIEQMKVRAEAELEIFRANKEGEIKAAELAQEATIEGAKLEHQTQSQDKDIESKQVKDMVKVSGPQFLKKMEENAKAVNEAINEIRKGMNRPRLRSGTFNGKTFEIREA